MSTPHYTNGPNGKRTHASDDDALLAGIERDPEAAAIALIEAIDRFLSAGCPVHPACPPWREPLRIELDAQVEGSLPVGINCPICNFSY